MKKGGEPAQCIYGFHAVESMLLHKPQYIQTAYVSSSRHDQRLSGVVNRLVATHIPVVLSTDAQLSELARCTTHQGLVVAVRMPIPTTSLDTVVENTLQQKKTLFLLVLDGVTDAHNLGACLRVADAMGVDAVVLPKNRSAPLNAIVMKTSAGAAVYTPCIYVTNLSRSLRQLKDHFVTIIGTSAAAKQTIFDITITSPLAWVMGAEGSGLRRLTEETCDRLVTIPMYGRVRSLNVSTATAICLCEAKRAMLVSTHGCTDSI